ncbi:MAG TPA: GGDEF domain-containing protein [Gammaproteobacteria bacterium]|jgi:diguanylate cyclase (GGDEF)-like protein
MQEGSESRILSRYSARDGLTGAFTRPYFLSQLVDEWRFALDMGKPFCICLIDIDQLRKVNEQHGLSAGDTLIADTAEAIRGTLDLPQWGNLRCLMGRYDGDSLMLLLPGCRLKRAEQFAFRIRQAISKLGSTSLTFTVSIAIAAFNGTDTVDGLLARIEKTLCLAKQFGGDGIEISHTAELTRDLATVTRLPVKWHGEPKLKN